MSSRPPTSIDAPRVPRSSLPGAPLDRMVDVGGLVRFLDYEGPAERTFVLVHGLGGSAINWVAVAPALAAHGRVLALDLPGFGRSPWRRGEATLDRLRATLGRFIRSMSPGPVVLVGNSMGGMLAMLQAGAEPSTVSHLVLACPALLPAPLGSHDRTVTAMFAMTSAPLFGPWFSARQRLRVPAEQSVDQMLRLCGVRLEQLDPAVLAAHHALARERFTMDWSIPAYIEASRSLLTRLLTRRHQVAEAIDRVQAPTLLMQGERDRLVLSSMSTAVARRRPDWQHVVLPGSGHVPMLENPADFVQRVLAFVSPS